MRRLVSVGSLAILLGAFWFLLPAAAPRVLLVTAAQESPQVHLRKLSLHIRDLDPDRSEYRALEGAVRTGATPAFFASKAQDYLRSPEHADKMNYRLNEIFELRNTYAPLELIGVYKGNGVDRPQCGSHCYEDHNSLNALFREVAARNLSWDTIFTAKEYSVYDATEDSFGEPRISDAGFYGAVRPDLPPSAVGIIRSVRPGIDGGHDTPVARIRFEPSDLRVAGALTTTRFFDRYTNVAVNKNRRRAAAVFRIGLCDAMTPSVVQPGAEKIKELLGIALSTGTSARDHTTAPPAADLHGKQRDCMACHRKLDPAGQVFNHVGVALSDVPSSGALVYEGDDGKLVNIPVHGVGELADALVKQQRYAECQVQYFWQWFIGVDVPLDPQRRTQLVVEFNARDRRVNDFIAYLVSQPEFMRLPARTDEVRFADVKSTFDKCDGCHKTMAVDLPALTTLPMGGSGDTMMSTVNRLVAALDLKHDGIQASMPPNELTSWRLSHGETLAIKNWLVGGARDDLGKPTVNPTKIEWK